ncbi:SDR family NAD(P)-dependent oxidoreductase, partial [Kitasatospora xanthocidica]
MGETSPSASTVQDAREDAVAVIGMACRLPRAATPDAYWRLLSEGTSAVGGVPADRWDLDALPLDDLTPDARQALRHGAFVDRVDGFDAGFFGISPREAAAMDPQQRLMAELGWEALEDARLLPDTLHGTATGVFVGAIAHDYATLLQQHGPRQLDTHSLTGLQNGVIANRLSYLLGAHGPSLTVDTGQSSSLVAVHLAVESLRKGESSLALAGGVSLNLLPESAVAVAKFGALSPDGRCATFDARANGYVRGEGGAVLVLKPLARALADGDTVYGVIRGSAVNSDGGTDGLAKPGPTTQAAVLRAACDRAGVDPAAVQYVELHGTGTRIGDPIEAEALGRAYGTERTEPLLVGSAKTNIGHLEGAAGIAGLLKAVLSVHHRRIPASLHYEHPNPRIDLDGWKLRVQTEAGPWPHPDRPLLAGVSSFGIGGTNCHLVLSGPPADLPAPEAGGDAEAPRVPMVPWLLSGRTEPALRAQAARLREHLDRHPEPDDERIGWSLATTRATFEHRAVLVGEDRARLLAGLDALALGEDAPRLVRGRAGRTGGTVLVFPGQGSQWHGMAVGLLDRSPVFRQHLEACDAALAEHLDWSLLDVLRQAPGAPSLDRSDVVQPALFAVMVSLARLWESLGIRPDAVVGHSQGEIAAAHIAGAFTLREAARISALRSKVLMELRQSGNMASVPLPADEVAELIAESGAPIEIGAYNSPSNTVLCGPTEAVTALLERCAARNAPGRLVNIDYPSHSAGVEPIERRLLAELGTLTPRSSDIPFYSTVTGAPLDTAELTAEYWYANLRRPVLFRQAVEALAADGHGVFVESSPHPVLLGGIRLTLAGAEQPPVVISTLRRNEAEWPRVLTGLAELHTRGVDVPWRQLLSGRPTATTALPTYPFQRERHWAADESAPGTARGAVPHRPVAATAAATATATATATEPEPAGRELGWAERLAQLPDTERLDRLHELVRTQAAVVLGHATADTLDPDRTFKDLGFDSTLTVEFCTRLASVTGLPVPSTTTYDHPTPGDVVRHLHTRITGPAPAGNPLAPAHPGTATGPRPDEPIAIIGMACRYPGGVSSPEDLWRLVADGVDAVSAFPTDRGWDLGELYDPEPGLPGRTYARAGGFLTGADTFDAAFFGIGPREAQTMDPQQRLLLETTWEALEHAGIDPATLRGSNTGVFTGIMSPEYGPRLYETAEKLNGYLLTGTTASVASGRIAYTFGFEGPAVTVDTACSSSLVALHMAAQSLRTGESDLVLAGGAAVMSTPGMLVEFSRQRGLSADGRCKAFSDSADGTGWAEGVGMLLVERLSDARRNGHRILAVVRGTAINQDGASNGLTAPNGPAQQRVIRQALANAQLTAADIDAVEAHGTGTALGDPIEAQALLATYGQDRELPFLLGSLKSNIGHAQAAAGVGGIIKTVEAMRHGVLPKTLHVDTPSTHVDWTEGSVELLTEAREWPETGRPRRAAVSSFGISGTNAHVIIEQAPEPAAIEPATPATEPALPLAWPLSARTPDALRDQATRLLAHIEVTDADPRDIAHSLTTTRAQLDQRAVVIGTGRDELLDALRALAEGKNHPGIVSSQPLTGRLAFLFTGQGAQRLGMGRELYEAFPVFASALDDVLARFDAPVREVMWGEDPDALNQTGTAQLALFAFETALYRLLESLGVRPDYLAGHSLGEITAAHASGILTLDDACTLVSARARLMQSLPTGGAMAALRATEDEILPLLGEDVTIAAVNSADSVVISGDEAAVEAVLAQVSDRKHTRLKVSHAFHSPLMDPILEDFRAIATSITHHAPTIPVISNLTGTPLTDANADYWVNHLRGTVRYHHTITHLAEQGVTTHLEIGPDAALTPLTPNTTPTTSRNHPEPRQLVTALATLHLTPLNPTAHTIPLPTYAFQRKRYWIAPSSTGLPATGHPLLGAVIETPDRVTHLTGRLSLDTHPWLADHRIAGTPILPASAFVDLVVHAGHHTGHPYLSELTLEAPLALPRTGGVQLRISLAPEDGAGQRAVTVHARVAEDADWVRHAEGVLASQSPAGAPATRLARPASAEPIDVTDLYDRLADRGYEYGPAFRGLRAAWRVGEEVYAEISLPGADQAEAYGLHPALLDAVLHAALIDGEALDIPFAWTGVTLYAQAPTTLLVRVTRTAPDAVALVISDPAGNPVAEVERLVLRPVARERIAAAPTGSDALLDLVWGPAPARPAPGRTGSAGRLAVLGTAPDSLTDAAADRFAGLSALMTALDGGTPAPDTVVALAPQRATDLGATAQEVLSLLQAWLAAERLADTHLMLVTRRAVATSAGEPVEDLAAAAVWGLVRTAQSEHPGRFTLVDTDGSEASDALLASAVALGEPQLALRAGTSLVPRVVRVTGRPSDEAGDPALDRDGTVLITGGTGSLGALVARHLVTAHGVRHLLLTSRRGPDAPGATELTTELTELGATVRVVACDATDRDALATVLREATPTVRAIVHTAGITDDGTLTLLTPERLGSVLAPKSEAAQHLHELSLQLGLDLTHFVLFSSVSGVLGTPGQANYAAANTQLDALAAHRHARGLPATSIAWGLWETTTGMAGQLEEADLARWARAGIPAHDTEFGLRLFDIALASGRPAPVAVRLDRAALRARAAAGTLPAVLGSLVPAAPARAQRPDRPTLGGTGVGDQRAQVLALVQSTAGAVLGHSDSASVPAARSFKELGFDSLAAVELRNRLSGATGMRLPSTVTFDYPTPTALADHLHQALFGGRPEADTPAPTATVSGSDEPIAIIGMACRYPGGVSSPEDLWRLVADGVDAVSEFPGDRGWDVDSIYHADPEHPGTSYTREGGFLHEAAEFDPAFFGINPREAVAMDPQQRLLLETTWESLERAGLDPTTLRGSNTGVFTGIMYDDYGARLRPLPAGYEGYVGNGSRPSVASGRVSYTFGFEGPAMTVDTACSSSLVALHLACQALRNGESDLALAGGATVMATASTFVEFSTQGALSADGRCKAFSDTADGTGWAEGVGMLLVERLSDARRNGHPVLAVVRGTAVNQDGASNGLTAPNGPAQQRVIRQALANAQLTAAEVDAVEAHGTGTTLGDPIEAQALMATYGQDRQEPLWLGSLKSNIGHSQAAAGVGGIIKMVEAMRHGVLPRTLHVDKPSTHVDWIEGSVELLTEAREWPETGRPRRAAVSSFGISGTNAHVIIEQGPRTTAATPTTGPNDASLTLAWPLSGHTEAALRDQAARLLAHVEATDADPRDIAHSLATTRAQLDQRAVVIGSGRDELLDGLRALAEGKRLSSVVTGTATDGQLAFLFTGQGAQRLGMGQELYEAFPVFASALDAVLERFDVPVREVMWGEDPDALNQTGTAQLALFAFETALYRLLESLGVRADYLAGHSLGEITAAHASGILTLEDACTLVSARARLMQSLPTGGSMAALRATEDEVISHLTDDVTIAAVNSADSVVISGTEAAVDAVLAQFADRKHTRLKVSHAFHSPLMDPILEDFRTAAKSITHHTPTIPVISNLTGQPLTDANADYWVNHLRGTVRYHDAVTHLTEQGVTTHLEVGPDAALTPLTDNTTPTGHRNHPEVHQLVIALATLHTKGIPVTLTASGRTVDLPTYAFQHQRYWLATPAGSSSPDHPLLGVAIDTPDGATHVTARLSLDALAWLADHQVADSVVLPGTAFVELATQAGDRTGCPVVEELTLHAPLTVPEQGAVQLQTTVTAPDATGRRTLTIHSRLPDEQDWTRHAEGTLAPTTDATPEPLTTWPPTGAEPIPLDGHYDRLATDGLGYGPVFQGVRAAWRLGEDVYAEIALPETETEDATPYNLHPALLDAALHTITLTSAASERTALPFSWSGLHLHATGARALRVRITPRRTGEVALTAADTTGRPVLTLDSLTLREFDPAQIAAAGTARNLYRVVWKPLTAAVTTAVPVAWADLAPDAPAPDLLQLSLTPETTDLHHLLGRLQEFLTEPRYAAGHLLVTTRQAVAARPEDLVDPTAAAAWGLIRSAQNEQPDRITLLDVESATDPSDVPVGQPELVLREGTFHTPQLVRASVDTTHQPTPFDPDATVLITGGTGTLGALIARHLITHHGVRHLLLTSRRGPDAPGATQLTTELTQLGATVRIVACDTTDRHTLTTLLREATPT